MSRESIRRAPDQRLSRTRIIAAALALPLVLGYLAFRQSREPKFYDFGQFYMGGVIAQDGAWESLYPVPLPESKDNAGWAHASTMRPRYAALAAERRVGDVNRFILPPPTALLFLPLAWFSYPTAHLVWVVCMALAACALGLAASHTYSSCGGKRVWVAALLALAVPCSPLMLHTLRTGQVSPLVAVCIALGVLGIRSNRSSWTVISIAIGAFAKYVTLMLVPLAAITARGKVLGWLAAVMAGISVAVLAVTGPGPFLTFFGEIVPTFSAPNSWQGNQGVHGFLIRTAGWQSLPNPVQAALFVIGFCLLSYLLWAIWRSRDLFTGHAPWVMASSCGLIAWFVIFSPVSWEHYHVYFCGFWGWLVYEAERSARWRPLALAALISSASAAAVFPGTRLPEPALSHMLWSSMILFGLALNRLRHPPSGAPESPAPSPAEM